MVCGQDGKSSCIHSGELPNVFALVVYIPGPLGRFLDGLRRELVPHDNPRAHVSVLPPRSLPDVAESPAACDEVRRLTGQWQPFRVEAAGVEVFPGTGVIYLELGAGGAEFHALHRAMNVGRLAWEEPFPYHPHITLAQDVEPGRVPELAELARRRWNEFRGNRSFLADRAVFVRNVADGCWGDVAEVALGSGPPRG